MIVLFFTSSGYGDLYYYGDFASFDAVTQTTIAEDFESLSISYNTQYSSFTSKGNTYTGLSSGTYSPNVYVTIPGTTNYGTADGENEN